MFFAATGQDNNRLCWEDRLNTNNQHTIRFFTDLMGINNISTETFVEHIYNGADINAVDNALGLNNNALMWAIANCATQNAINFLNAVLMCGTDILNLEHKDTRGKSALMLAVYKGWHHRDTEGSIVVPRDRANDSDINMGAVIELLIQLGADINTRNNKGMTPLHVAMMMRDIEAIIFLCVNFAVRSFCASIC